MTTNAEQEAINQARANRNGGKRAGSGQSNPPKEKAVNTKSGAQRIQEKLEPAKEAVAQLTERTLLSGIPLGLHRFATGEFSEEGEETFEFLSDFTASIEGLIAGGAYSLMSSDDESKKMLPGAVDAVVVE